MQIIPIASGKGGVGKSLLSANLAIALGQAGKKVVLVRLETSPEDIEGMHVSEGILTVRGGMTSHAAVVARGMGACCVSGAGEIKVNEAKKFFEVGGKKYVQTYPRILIRRRNAK